MKKLLVIGIILFSISSVFAQCDDYQSSMSNVKSYASDAYTYAKKAYNSDSI